MPNMCKVLLDGWLVPVTSYIAYMLICCLYIHVAYLAYIEYVMIVIWDNLKSVQTVYIKDIHRYLVS